jgi:uncharacterized lipoprotein YmbA
MIPAFPALPSRASGPRVLALVALVAVVSTLAACSLSRPYAVKRTYMLEPTAPAAAAATKATSVRVGVVNVAAPFRGKSFVYRETDLKYEADFYDEFFIAPTAMLSDATAKALAAAKVFRRVVPFGAVADDGDFVLDGFVSELYADTRNAATPTAVLSITFYLSPNAVAGSSVIWSREYRQRVAASGASPEALAAAWNTALSSILAELARDLAAAELPVRTP